MKERKNYRCRRYGVCTKKAMAIENMNCFFFSILFVKKRRKKGERGGERFFPRNDGSTFKEDGEIEM